MNRCQACHMVFDSAALLQTHVNKFCWGSHNKPKPDHSKVAQLKRYKDRQASRRAAQDLQDQQLLASIDAKDRWSHRAHDLRELKGMARHELHDYSTRHQAESSLGTNSSISIHLSSDEDTPPKPTQDKALQDLQQHVKALEEQNLAMATKINNLSLQEKLKPAPTAPVRDFLYGERQPAKRSGNQGVIDDINALRTRYLQQGGADAQVLSQMMELELEALALENKQRADRKQDGKYLELQKKYMEVQEENRRIQETIDRIREESNKQTKQEAAEIKKKQDQILKTLEELQKEARQTVQQPTPQPAPHPANQPVQIHQHQYEPGFDSPRYQPSVLPPVDQQPYYPPHHDHTDLLPAPYDPNAGFMVFYDFLLGLDTSIRCCRLVVGLYNSGGGAAGEPTTLPAVYAEGAVVNGAYPPGPSCAVMKAKQPVPNCHPDRLLSLLIEFQSSSTASEYHTGTMVTRAWCKLDLFDDQNRLQSGRWRLPLRMNPIKSHVSTAQLNSIPQFGITELYIRLVNYRDVYSQSLAEVQTDQAAMYHYPVQTHYGSVHGTHSAIPPPPTAPPPATPYTSRVRPDSSHDFYDIVGFQIDKVQHAEMGEAKVRLTAYYKKTGKVVQAESSPLTCCTIPARLGFRHQCHVFGQQEAVFHDIKLTEDIVVIARFYLRRRAELFFDDTEMVHTQDLRLHDDETLVAWTAFPLVVNRQRVFIGDGPRGGSSDHLILNTGPHTLPLYETPVPNVTLIPLEPHQDKKTWKRYNEKATLKVVVFEEPKGPNSVPPSDSEGESDDEESLEGAWLRCDYKHPLTESYKATDGFDLYVDGCRGLPDSVTITKIVGQVMNRKWEKVGKYFSAELKLESDIYNPLYELRVQCREPNMPPSSTLLIKLYTLDKFTSKLMVVGYATLNIFVEVGTHQQPTLDTGGIQLSLNAGGHQIRVYHKGPARNRIFNESCLRDAGVRPLPCATVLVRLVKAPTDEHGITLKSERIPQMDWARLGLWHARPDYSDRVYNSMSSIPSPSEIRLYKALARRSYVSAHEAMRTLSEETNQLQDIRDRSRKGIQEYIRILLTKPMDTTKTPLLDIDTTYISRYSPRYGIKVSIDSAHNLTWPNFTHASFCISPPACFYMGPPNAPYDKPAFTRRLNLSSTNTHPSWNDGYHSFSYRSYHRFMAVIIHLQEIRVEVTDQYKYSLNDQAWTVLPVFKDNYAQTGAYQLPLFTGAPTMDVLRQISQGPFVSWAQRSLENNLIQFADTASVIVRVCDGRRDSEYEQPLGLHHDYVSTEYIPKDRVEAYATELPGQQLSTLVPQSKSYKNFTDTLASKYKTLVYKLYEGEGEVNQD